MKICPNCRAEVDDTYDICWNCQYSFTEDRVISKNEFSETCPYCNAEVNSELKYCPSCYHELGLNSVPFDPSANESYRKVVCLRCQKPMVFKGNFKFHEGTRYGVFGDLFELMTNRESFDIFYCSECGKVEFYIPKNTSEEE